MPSASGSSSQRRAQETSLRTKGNTVLRQVVTVYEHTCTAYHRKRQIFSSVAISTLNLVRDKGSVFVASVSVCIFYLFICLLTFSMLHYIVILHALGLSIHNMVTYIYNLCTISSIFYRYRYSLLSVFLCITNCFLIVCVCVCMFVSVCVCVCVSV